MNYRSQKRLCYLLAFCFRLQQVKYLGHIITDKLKDDADIIRELRKSYTRINTIIRRFSQRFMLVKLRLFRGHFLFYGVALWYKEKKNFTKCSLNKLRSCYHKCIKIFLAILNFIVLLPYFWNCLCLVFCTLVVHNSQYRFRGSTALTILLLHT